MTALAMRQQGLKPAAKIVLYWLADHHNSETDLCCPSLNTLAAECEMSRATLVRHLDDLEALGLIGRAHRTRENGSQTSTAYTLNMAGPVSKQNSPCSKMKQAPVSKCDPHNLGIDNLGNEPSISSNEEIVIRAVDDVYEAVTIYNDAAERSAWPSVQKMTPQRRKALRGRLSECGGLDGWKCAIGKAEASDFLCGRTSKPWTGFGFDWITKAANFTKLMEGNYDNRAKQDATSNPSGVHSDPTLRAILAAAGSFKA